MEPLFILSVFVAGMLMFLAPCTLPLLPAYLGFISGVTEEEVRDPGTRSRARWLVLRNGAAFVLGFMVVYIVLGTLTAFAASFIAPIRGFLSVVGGIIVIVFGLIMMGYMRFNALVKERRARLPSWLSVGRPSSAFVLGTSFAFGWTPCIGPVLGTVLMYAGSGETVLYGTTLLFIFGLGFSVPFLALAFLIERAAGLVEKATPYLRAISFVGGIVLIILGLDLVFGDTPVTRWFFDLLRFLDFEGALMRFL